jgi:glycosyltransferase involved in cell wall biosynthesis
MGKTVCFFAKVKNRSVLERFEFYTQDLRILEELGLQVEVAVSPSQVRRADLYFVWWWTWAFFPVLAARTVRRPVLVTGTFDYWAFDGRPALHRAMMKYALAHADANIFVSNLEYRLVPANLRVKEPGYVPHVIDTDVYLPGPKPREDFVFTVVHLEHGNARRKCIPELIQAARRVQESHPGTRFVIAGEKGSDFPGLENLVRSLGAESYIEFLGAISLEQKVALMQRCRVYASPSRYEGFGLATLEAMSCGAPVVGSPVGAMPEVVGDAGLLVNGEDPAAIAEGIARYLTNDAMRNEMSKRARIRAETVFPYSRRKNELGKVIESLLGRSQRPVEVPETHSGAKAV